jgi:hypothetical protein
MTGKTCVGDLRLTPLDVGFDVRLHDMAVALPAEFASAGIDVKGQTHLIEGTRAEMIAAIIAAGYKVQEPANAD